MPRLDQALLARGLYASRSRARDAILRGAVTVEGRVATKPGQPVAESALIEIADKAGAYVSRAALKLRHGLDQFGLSPRGLHALDIGASTGGFTQVLLECGAARVTAIDVGRGQFAPSLRADRRVRLIEGLNARELEARHLGERPQFVVADVSFISLKLALPPALALAEPGARLVALVKPQFEAGPDHLGRTGVVRDQAVREAVCEDISRWLELAQGWTVLGVTPSPLPGGEGNVEYLIAATKP